MTPEESKQAVSDQARVVARTGPGEVYGSGRVIAYSLVPVLTIVSDDGSRFTWRHDMCDEERRA